MVRAGIGTSAAFFIETIAAEGTSVAPAEWLVCFRGLGERRACTGAIKHRVTTIAALARLRTFITVSTEKARKNPVTRIRKWISCAAPGNEDDSRSPEIPKKATQPEWAIE